MTSLFIRIFFSFKQTPHTITVVSNTVRRCPIACPAGTWTPPEPGRRRPSNRRPSTTVTITWRTSTITTITIIRIITRRWWRITITAQRPIETSPPLRITTRLPWPRRPSRGGSRPPTAVAATDDNGSTTIIDNAVIASAAGTIGRKICLFIFSLTTINDIDRVKCVYTHTRVDRYRKDFASLCDAVTFERDVHYRITVFFHYYVWSGGHLWF